MTDRSTKMALIGAGPVGLAMAKALGEQGLPYEQLEADSEPGGNWFHGVYETVHIISSRKTTEYADYPMPKDYPDFPSRQQMLDYLRAYAAKFHLAEHLELNTKVVMVRPLAGDRWEIELASGEKRVYKGVVVCNGHHWSRRFPNYPGEFDGELIHSKDYRNPSQVAGKRVLVVGGGNSACDIAAEAARVGKSASISLRRGYWFLPKTLLGIPSAELMKPYAPVWLQRFFLKLLMRISIGKFEDYGLPRPNHRIFEAHPTINSELLYYVKHGRIRPRPDIARFEGKTIHFVDGSSGEFDLVVCATGYHVSFPFLPAGMVPVKGSTAQLYGGCVLAEYKNLYVIGTSQLRYGFGPVVTPGVDFIARMIKAQEQMELPIGLVLKESGVKLPTTHLVDPHAALRGIRRGKRMLPLLVWREKRLRKKFLAEVAARPAFVDTPVVDRGVEVF
ncbi:MAG TPA: NAD(P)-binding domain-containing protein [Candidatus Acidoferrum sp.]|jgi:cation diffusion facilitator CzcD-associated flavoprotein CzcO